MNHVHQLNNLLVLQKKYKDFMPFCPNSAVQKLTTELQRITARISKLNTMNIKEVQMEATVFFETKQSKMNFLYS